MNKVKVGIIGAGYIAQHHLSVLKDLPEVEVVAVCNRGEEKRIQTSQKYNIPYCYSSYHDMFKNHRLDAIFICVSAHNMSQVILDCLDQQIPLLVEKPVSLNLKDAEKIVDKASRLGVPVMVGVNRRFMSSMEKAKELIKNRGGLKGIIIEMPERMTEIIEMGHFPEEITKNWIYANSIHCIDLFRYFGGEINKTISFSKKEEQIFVASLEFEKNIPGFYYSFRDAPGNWSVYLFCDKKTKITIKPLEKVTLEVLGVDPRIFKLADIDQKYKPGFYKQDSYFIKNIVINKEKISFPASDIQDNLKTMELISQIEGVNS